MIYKTAPYRYITIPCPASPYRYVTSPSPHGTKPNLTITPWYHTSPDNTIAILNFTIQNRRLAKLYSACTLINTTQHAATLPYFCSHYLYIPDITIPHRNVTSRCFTSRHHQWTIHPARNFTFTRPYRSALHDAITIHGPTIPHRYTDYKTVLYLLSSTRDFTIELRNYTQLILHVTLLLRSAPCPYYTTRLNTLTTQIFVSLYRYMTILINRTAP